MVWFAILLAHLLMLFLVIAVPLRGARRYKTLLLRIARYPEQRTRFYINGMLGQWLMLVPLAVIAFGLGWSPAILGLQAPDRVFLAILATVLLVVVFYGQVWYIRRTARSLEGRVQLRQSMSGPLLMLPRTPKERTIWVFLSLTAGFCEELLYRGFMPAYLVHIFPGVNLIFAILIAAVLFGMGHVYQKLTAVIGTAPMVL